MPRKRRRSVSKVGISGASIGKNLLPEPSLSKAVACPPAPRGGDFERRDTLFAGNAARADVLCPRRESHASAGPAPAVFLRLVVLRPNPGLRRGLRPKRLGQGGSPSRKGRSLAGASPSCFQCTLARILRFFLPPCRDFM